MDVDDFDQNLLLQFSCMGTTDKDELIKQLQTLVGYQLNSNAASFFLEMNNWNLQGAVGAYFDAQSLKLPSMSIVSGIAERDTWVLPGSKFVKSWEVQNTGDEAWPPNCRLQFTGGQQMTANDLVPVGPLQPGCRATLCFEMTAPEILGIFESKWRMSTSSGSYFGDVIWVIITVSNEPPSDQQFRLPVTDQSLNGLAHQLSSLTPLGSSPRQFSLASNPFNQFSSSQPKAQNESQSSMDEDGNMLCYQEVE